MTQTTRAPGGEPLNIVQRALLVLLLLTMLGFGGIVVMRSAFLQRRMTDFGVFARSAWALRAGENPYTTPDDNNLYYMYPITTLLPFVPLADPPVETEVGVGPVLPFAVSAGAWYALSVLLLAWSCHALALALEETSPDPLVRELPTGCRRWWHLRTLPALACAAPIGHTLSRGQINIVVLACMVFMVAAAVRRRPYRAGFWLAAAATVKVIPLALLVVPIARRDWRWLAGALAGLVLLLGVVPAVALGPTKAIDMHREWWDRVVMPGAAVGEAADAVDDALAQSRRKEWSATDSQSFAPVLHAWLNSGEYTEEDIYREPFGPGYRVAHAMLSLIAFGLVALAAAKARTPPQLAIAVGLAALAMTMASPISHQHYVMWVMPILAGVWCIDWQRAGAGGWLRPVPLSVSFALLLGTALVLLPGIRHLRFFGMAVISCIPLVIVGVREISRGGVATPPGGTSPAP